MNKTINYNSNNNNKKNVNSSANIFEEDYPKNRFFRDGVQVNINLYLNTSDNNEQKELPQKNNIESNYLKTERPKEIKYIKYEIKTKIIYLNK